MSSFPFDHPPSRRPAADRPPIRWWLVGPLGAFMGAVLVRWLSDGGLRQLAAARNGERDPPAALASLKQAPLPTVPALAPVAAPALLGVLLRARGLIAGRPGGPRRGGS